MARDDGRAANFQLALCDVQVCTADAAGGNAHEYFIIGWNGRRSCG
jgi:hypothetical protein